MSTQTCAYCRKERPESEMKKGTIIFRNSRIDPRTRRRKQFVDRKENWYCADANCHAHDQWAHEG